MVLIDSKDLVAHIRAMKRLYKNGSEGSVAMAKVLNAITVMTHSTPSVTPRPSISAEPRRDDEDEVWYCWCAGCTGHLHDEHYCIYCEDKKPGRGRGK